MSNGSILKDIRKTICGSETATEFDTDLIMHINTVFTILTQIGIGPAEGFSIEGESEVWDDFLDSAILLNSVKSYMQIKVRLIFDPPANQSLIDSMERYASELEWRLTITKVV